MSHQENRRAGQDAPTQYRIANEILNPTPSDRTKADHRKLILDAIRLAPLSTIEAREGFGIMSPASRVMELRRLGFKIDTVWRSVWDADGRPHRSAVYLMRGAE